MKELVAKRYAKALIEAIGTEKLVAVLEWLQGARKAFEVETFRELLSSPQAPKELKTQVVLEVLGEGEAKFINFIKALAEKNRLELIPEICQELDRLIAVNRNEYKAVLTTQEAFDEATLKALEETLAKKLQAKLAITQKLGEFDGVKLVVEDLGVEVSFSREKFVNDLRNHILKAF